MGFEQNVGQTDPRARFVARANGYAVFLTDDGAVVSFADDERAAVGRGAEPLRMRFAGARAGAHPAGAGTTGGRANYLTSDDRSAWRTNVPTYSAVRYEGLYDGVDAVFYGAGGCLEYDIVVAPGASAEQLRMRFEGQRSAEVSADGDLVLRVGNGEARLRRAAAYQEDGGVKRAVSTRFAVDAAGEVRLEVGAYDPRRPLVVDPVLVYASYLGGSQSFDQATSLAVDATGSIYVCGRTDASDFPTTEGAFDRTGNRQFSTWPVADVFVAKLSADAGTLVYATYLGGVGDDFEPDLAVDSAGRAVVVGTTESTDFPTTSDAADATLGGWRDAFLMRLSADGASLVYSTYIGGSGEDHAGGVAVDAAGGACVVGWTGSADFPTGPAALDMSLGGESDAFATRFSPSNATIYSTYLGGGNAAGAVPEAATAVAFDAAGVAWIAGRTVSPDFPTTPGAYDTSFNDGTDVFLSAIDSSGLALQASTFFGGEGGELPQDVAVGPDGRIYVVGSTSSDGFPKTPGAFDTVKGDEPDAFVACFSASAGSLVYSSYLGGDGEEEAQSVAVDADGAAYVVGWIEEAGGFPITPGAFDSEGDAFHDDGFVTKVNSTGTAILGSTLLGGEENDEIAMAVAVDAGGVHVCGRTWAGDFPVTAGAYDTSFNGGFDAFVTTLTLDLDDAVSSTLLSGGTSAGSPLRDNGYAIAVDDAGAAYVTGATQSINFPVTPGAYDTTYNGWNINTSRNIFVAKVAPDGGGLVWATFIGYGWGAGIAVDASGAVVVAGNGRVPTTPGAFEEQGCGGDTPFVAKFTPDGAGLVYSTLLGTCTFSTTAWDVALDPSGNVYVAGVTSSSEFPTTPGAFDTTFNGSIGDAFISKLNPSGTALVYSSFLGAADYEAALSVAVDASGAAYLAGHTGSAAFPTTPGAFDTTLGGESDAFVTKVHPSGASLVYSTFLGGGADEFRTSDLAEAIAVGAGGAAYVTGTTQSPDFPVTPDAFDPVPPDPWRYERMFVTKLDAGGGSLGFSTFLGGTDSDKPFGIAVDAAGGVWVAGQARSSDFPCTPDAYDLTLSGPVFEEGFLTRLSAAGDALAYSSFLGQGLINDLAVDASGTAYMIGDTFGTHLTSGFGVRDSYNVLLVKLRPPVAGSESDATPGLYLPSSGAWFLRNENAGGAADVIFTYGAGGAGLVPVTGDWDGDGDETAGLYDPATGAFFLKNANSGGGADLVFTFGAGGQGFIPLAGDWDGDSIDTIGLYVPATGVFFLRNQNGPGGADAVFTFGAGGAGVAPLVGDWNADGVDTVGLYGEATATFFLKNASAPGGADLAFSYGPAGATPVVGDWNGDGVDTVGIYAAGSGAWFLKNTNSPGAADLVFGYGPPGATPLAGDWDGQ
jgi:hypothetical protein